VIEQHDHLQGSFDPILRVQRAVRCFGAGGLYLNRAAPVEPAPLPANCRDFDCAATHFTV